MNGMSIDYARAARELLARATACDVEACDGASHDGTGGPKDWLHVVREGFIGPISWSLVHDGLHGAVVSFTPDDLEGNHGPDELRALADAFETAPALLRALADELERRRA